MKNQKTNSKSFIEVKLTKTDKAILESYKLYMDGLAQYLGKSYEIVLHSLESKERSVIKIINGFHTGRSVGSPITDFAIEMLNKIRSEGNQKLYECYFSTNKQGELLKSTSIAIMGEYDRIVGMMCINFYMNTPYADIINSFVPNKNIEDEHFLNETEDSDIVHIINKAKMDIYGNQTIDKKNVNKEIVNYLYAQGVFKMKNAVELVASELGISKNTVYLHIRNIEK